MAWLFILGRQIEERISRWRMILMILIIGVVANVAQYLMDGPFFLGFSGVIVGMAGFIWMRQKHAPWEGYPLQRATSVFIFLFVLAMFALELVGFSLQFFSVTSLSPNIANTAHIVGGVLGLLFGRYSFFSREAP
jgi:GlpG protein